MIKEQIITWEGFKNVVSLGDSSGWVYRGHASKEWHLETTLYRFLGRKQTTFFAKHYYELLTIVLTDERIKKIS